MEEELKETKGKLSIVTQKFSQSKKEVNDLKKVNKELLNEVMSLQSNIRQMVPGFSNTGSSFPLFNELLNEVSEFLKCDCQDAFFDLLCPELNLDGVVYFFRKTIEPVLQQIKNYFDPLYATLENAMCLDTVEGPVLNVMKKCYQNNWKKIYSKCFNDTVHKAIMKSIQSTLKLADGVDESINEEITSFVSRLSLICFKMYICDPCLVFDMSIMGQAASSNPTKMDSMDGFIKNGQESIIILPAVYKGAIEKEPVIKPNILPLDYEFP
ncbi:unnamed protein product [Moneuplotes crassus]|uniref:Uncharacterized protein n=1 Tax=Euplotes crassus TaxID=5936 RepID=A0AAD1XPH5_EUPCR|nr:unnamed protein product [Moneuplotes crassus]